MLLRRSHHRKMVLHRWSKPFWFWCWYWWCCSILVVTEASRSSFPLSSSSSPSSYSFRRSLRERAVSTSLAHEHVCSNIDIRNSVDNFRKLNNCTVVEGFLQILLIDNASQQDFENLTFPKLREITDYLLLYRVQGLTTMAKLFPNLTVIKGRVLFYNYALVIFEMRTMHEVGLVSLTAIARGSVRIEKNPHLCYIDTIDWDLIARSGRGGHFIKDNKPFEQCPNACPAGKKCPQGSLPDSGRQVDLCWNSQACQKICSPLCEQQNLTCSSESHCCDQECIGGCFGSGKSDCIACKHVSFNGRCFKECPSNTFQYLGRRCIYDFECRAMKNKHLHWKPFNGKCLTHCPAGFTENEIDKHLCQPCRNRCPKVCEGGVVESVASAQKLRGCTYIDGSLEIQIQGGDNVIKELETSLSSIREIKGYLKIARSFPLISLNFLKDLTHIRGEVLDKKDYAFLVLENHNLQELWDWENRESKLRISGGKIFFHFNSKLCPNKIQELKKYAKVMDWDERDVSPNSNGDRVACNVIRVEISVWQRHCEMAGLQWKNFRKHYQEFDFRSLLGYVVYYREAPSRNVTKFDGRDACGSDVWKVDDVEAQNDDDDLDEVLTIITQLKPYTTYAAYMRTYTIASAPIGAESEIIYFTTKPFTPSLPTNVRARSTSHNEIVISWSVPKKPNGNVTHYIIDGIREKDFSEFVSQRNYCSEPLVLPRHLKPVDDHRAEVDPVNYSSNGTSSPESEDSKQCCACAKNTRLDKQENDAEFQIHFEDFLHNSVYIKNPDPDRSRKQNMPWPNIPRLSTKVYNSSSTEPTLISRVTAGQDNAITITTTEPTTYNKTDIPIKNDENRFHHVIYKHMFHVVGNLHHFTEYTIEIRACQEDLNETCNRAPPCSTRAITIVRTLALEGADDIDNNNLVVNTDNVTTGSIFIKWDEPKDPNGLIVSYQIELRPADAQDYKPIPICITQSDYALKMGYSFYDLSPANYSLRLRAVSLAGNGNWTKPRYFIIPEVKDGISPEVLAVLTVFTIIAIPAMIGASIYFFKRKYALRSLDGILYASANPEYMSAGLVYEPDEWEILRDDIDVGPELGQGSFGMVYKGVIKGLGGSPDPLPCAVKTVNNDASIRERIEFLQEASVMKAFNCHHIVKLLGVVSKGNPTLVIMELMSKGDLKAFLRAHRPDNEDPDIHPPTYRDILQMAIEIADGMAYLSAKKFVHRDLAARNCMVAHGNTVKIGDFGMTRDIYETDYYRKGGKGLLPVRWMAPECLKDGVFSCQSDIWSYGVVLWEMATFASQPYQGLANEQVLNYVIAGRIMEKPEDCPEKLYDLMKLCWVYTPKLRLTFTEVIAMLLPDIDKDKFFKVSFYSTIKPATSPKETETGDNESLSTPLRIRAMESGERAEDSEEEAEEDDLQYFPPTRNILENNYIHNSACEGSSRHTLEPTSPASQSTGEADGGATGNDGSRGHSIYSNEGSRGMSSSDGSKGSKVSNMSNGGIANGCVAITIGRTTTC